MAKNNQELLREGLRNEDEEQRKLFGDQSQFWTVGDMMAFENIGFSRPLKSGLKYLICAECEILVGYHIPSEQPSIFYISTEKVKELI